MQPHAHARDVPRKGNVDRNFADPAIKRRQAATFPARGTWIEMRPAKRSWNRLLDVPRKGNVDRNDHNAGFEGEHRMTFPARGTWIEISDTEVSELRAAFETFPARGTWIEITR